MALDPNILLQGQAPQIQNPLDAMSKVMTLKQLGQQTQATDRSLADDQAMRDAYRQNMSVGPDGLPTMNRSGMVSQLAQTNPMLAMQKGRELQSQDVQSQDQKLDLVKKQTDAAHELSMSITGPDNWAQVRQKGIDLGLPNADQLPQQYPGDAFVQHMQAATVGAKDQIDQHLKQQEFNLRQQELDFKRTQVSTSKQAQSLDQVQKLLESARGNPAAAQAEKDIYAAQKLNSLVDLYGDPNKLSPQQVQLAASEVAKIATGGVPTSHELQGLVPATIPSGLANVAQSVANNPTGAQAGEFLKQYKDYAQSLSKDAQKVIQDKYGRVIETRKSSLGPDNYQALQDNYVNRFKPPQPPAAPVQMRDPQGNIRMVPADQVDAAKAAGGTAL